MLGMSKAFDTVDVSIVFKYLNNIDNDELYLINIILDTQLENNRGAKKTNFQKDICIPQGDGLIWKQVHPVPVKFSLQAKRQISQWTSTKREHIRINLGYADDISAVTDNHAVPHI